MHAFEPSARNRMLCKIPNDILNITAIVCDWTRQSRVFCESRGLIVLCSIETNKEYVNKYGKKKKRNEKKLRTDGAAVPVKKI